MLALLDPSHWYRAAAAGYALLMLYVLFAGGRGLFRVNLLVLSMAGIAWALVIAGSGGWAGRPSGPVSFLAETGYAGAWHLLLHRMLRGPYRQSMPVRVRGFLVAFWVLLVLCATAAVWYSGALSGVYLPVILDTLSLAASLSCLALASQLHQDAPVEGPGVARLLVVAAAFMSVGQVLVLVSALFGGHPALVVALSRAMLSLVIIVLLALGIHLRPQWSLAIFVSPQARSYVPRFLSVTVALLLLVVMVPFARTLQTGSAQLLAVALVGALSLPLVALLFSEALNARMRVFLSKRFLAFRYNYRDQWLRLIDTLASPEQKLPLPERAIKAVAGIVASPGGLLWMREAPDGPLICVAAWNARLWSDASVAQDDPVIRFMRERQWILDTAELSRNPGLYEGILRPAWLESFPDALLLVPLLSNKALIGFVLLLQSSSSFRLTFEEIDLLRTSGRQVAAHLAQYEADQRLSEARQFEAFNRLTAFLMHDLKNLIAQQSLVVSNAARHKGNPAFFEDAIATIENSVARMSKLLQQFQSGEGGGRRSRIRLAAALKDSLERCAGRMPVPVVEAVADELCVQVDRERFIMVIVHLLRNAQEAVAGAGQVRMRAVREAASVRIEIEDDGCGMDPEFVRTRLFRPFDTTKGSKGMGIGAYQARMFVIDSGGALDVRSAPGKGTCITIRLPLAEVMQDESAVERDGDR